jgi:hypothetical protein
VDRMEVRMNRNVGLIVLLGFVAVGAMSSAQQTEQVYTGQFINSKGERGPARLALEQTGRVVRGEWDGIPYAGAREGNIITFEVRNVEACRDYQVRVEFAPAEDTAALTYAVHDRCRQPSAYSGTEQLTRQAASLIAAVGSANQRQNLRVSLTASHPVIEIGEKVLTSAAVSGGTPPYQYEWFAGQRKSLMTAPNINWTNQGVGTTDIKVIVTDAAGARAEAQVRFVVRAASGAPPAGPAKAVIVQPLLSADANRGVRLGDLSTHQVTVTIPPSSFNSSLSPTVTVRTVQEVRESKNPKETLLATPVSIAIGDRPVRLRNLMQVTMKFDPRQVPPGTSAEYIRAAFWDGRRWRDFAPDKVDLQAGTITFSSGHMTELAPVKRPLESVVTTYLHNKAVTDFAQKHIVDRLVDKLANEALDKIEDRLHLTDESLKAKLYGTIIKSGEMEEIRKQAMKVYNNGLTKPQEDDVTDLVQKVTLLSGKTIIELTPESKMQDALKSVTENADLVSQAAEVAGNLAAGDLKGAAKVLASKMIDDIQLSKVVKAVATGITFGIDTWKNIEVEAAYKAFREGRESDEAQSIGYDINAGNFEAVWGQMEAVARQLAIEAIRAETEGRDGVAPSLREQDIIRAKVKADLKTSFETRAKRDEAIAAEEVELNKLMAACQGRGLLDDASGFQYTSFDTPEGRLGVLLRMRDKILRDLAGKRPTRPLTNDDIASLAAAYLAESTTQKAKVAYAALLKRLLGVDLAPPPASGTLAELQRRTRLEIYLEVAGLRPAGDESGTTVMLQGGRYLITWNGTAFSGTQNPPGAAAWKLATEANGTIQGVVSEDGMTVKRLDLTTLYDDNANMRTMSVSMHDVPLFWPPQKVDQSIHGGQTPDEKFRGKGVDRYVTRVTGREEYGSRKPAVNFGSPDWLHGESKLDISFRMEGKK